MTSADGDAPPRDPAVAGRGPLVAPDRPGVAGVGQGRRRPGRARWAVDVDGAAKGLIQVYEWPDEDYRNASIDVFLDASVHGKGIGREIVGAVMAYCVDERHHHRITIDPAADNTRPPSPATPRAASGRSGVMRQYERDTDGPGWHDGLFMEWVAGIDPRYVVTTRP